MLATLCALLTLLPASADQRVLLEYRPAPIDNPLKGLVPYQSDVRAHFPHSLEFQYIPYDAIVKGYDDFDWAPMETFLNDVASRGHQGVVRIYLEFPNRQAIPQFLLKDGLVVHEWVSEEGGEPTPPRMNTPDYENKALRTSLTRFVAAFGKKYDGDPRLGFVTAGLLGLWGEWHTWPRDDLAPGKAVQAELMDAYERAFRITPVLLRYPAGEESKFYAPNASRNFGYHDDSFAWGTLATGDNVRDWFFLPTLRAAGPAAVDKWKTRPIGGEIRPEAWGVVFDKEPGRREVQDFATCVEETHATWLMDSGMFRANQPAARIERAKELVRKMGYEFHVPTATIRSVTDGMLRVSIEIENRGVAPFYYDWKPEIALVRDRAIARSSLGTGTLRGLLAGASPRLWEQTIAVTDMQPGTYAVAIRVPNALKNGKPVKFANQSQDADVEGWLTLGSVSLR